VEAVQLVLIGVRRKAQAARLAAMTVMAAIGEAFTQLSCGLPSQSGCILRIHTGTFLTVADLL
jgi:hypothetical protein